MIVSELVLKREKEEKLLFSFEFKNASLYVVVDYAYQLFAALL